MTDNGIYLSSSDFTLDGYRLPYNPEKGLKDKGKSISLRTKYFPTHGGGTTQKWTSSVRDEEQVFKWDFMHTEFYEELKTRFDEVIADRTTTHIFTYHNLTPEETWNIEITELTGTNMGTYWLAVTLKFRLVSLVV